MNTGLETKYKTVGAVDCGFVVVDSAFGDFLVSGVGVKKSGFKGFSGQWSPSKEVGVDGIFWSVESESRSQD